MCFPLNRGQATRSPKMKRFVMNPICVVVLVVAGLSLAYLANVQFNKTGTFWPPQNARFTEEPSPLDKVMDLQHEASATGFPYGASNAEIIGTFYVWSANMGSENGLNIVTAAPRPIQNGEMLHRTPNEFWKKDGQLGPHNEELLHNGVEAILLPSELTATKGMQIVVKRHESGFLFGTPAAPEEEVLALN